MKCVSHSVAEGIPQTHRVNREGAHFTRLSERLCKLQSERDYYGKFDSVYKTSAMLFTIRRGILEATSLLSFIVWGGGVLIGVLFTWLEMRSNTKVGTPSASHNSKSDEIFPSLKRCCGSYMIMMVVDNEWLYWCQKCGNTSHV